MAGGTAQVTATVANDPANKGVNWTVTCSAAQCGSVSPTTTSSGSGTTYTAPPTPASDLMVTITATSASDSTKTVTTTIKVLAITVSISQTSASVAVSATQPFTATVANDAGAKGVTWTLSQGGAACSSACGSVSPTTGAGNTPATTYTAPASVPTPATVTITATSAADPTKSVSATITVTPSVAIGVSISPGNPSVNINKTQQFTATITNDPGAKGVTWTLTQGGATCSGPCGSVFPTSGTGNSPSTTYTAPATVPTPTTVTITATSVADPTASVSTTITVLPAISVSISPANPSIAINAAQQFAATVTNDADAKGVTWTLTQSGMACSLTCGSISPTSSSGNSPLTAYTAPAAVPTPAMVTITATSVADPTQSASTTITISACGSGNESVFAGQYAFLFQGFDPNGPVAIGGTFSADGTGKIALLVGSEDINNSSGVQTGVFIDSAASSYSVGPDNRGCMTIATASGTSTYRFSLGSTSSGVATATKGRMIEFDDTGTLGSGVLRLQDPTAFANTAISGGYAFGASSTLSLSLTTRNRFAVVGAFSADGAGGITAGEVDANNSGTVDGGTAGPLLLQNNSSTFSVAPNGRATFTLNFAGSAVPVHGIFYVVSSGEALTMSADPQSGAGSNPLFAGSVLKQSGGPFAASSLKGNSVFYTAGLCSGCGPTAAPVAPSLTVGVFGVTTTGNFSLSGDINQGGTLSTQAATGTYTVDSSGRVLLTPTGSTTPSTVVYLVSPNEGFVATTGASVDAGFVEPQVGAPFSTTSGGTYFFGSTSQVNQSVQDGSGIANFDVRNGVTGATDNASIGLSSSTPNLKPAQTISGTYTLTNSSATPGRGIVSMAGTTNSIFYIISHHCVVTCTSKLVLMDASTNTNPALTIGETR